MTNQVSPAQSSQAKFKIEQRPANGVLLIELLRTLETSLETRGLLKRHAEDLFNPLWYLAETERNIFLWKHGRSIIEHDDYEFWIDLPGLICKRISHLQSERGDNPFVNHLWGLGAVDDGQGKDREIDYLQTFLELTRKIEEHLGALCEVGSTLMSEINGRERPRVILPSARKA